MNCPAFTGFDPQSVPSPCYVLSRGRLEENAELLAGLRERTGAKILLALKGFAAWSTFPILRRHLDGICASGIHEARLGREEFGGEVHTYAPAFKPDELEEVLSLSDHVSFNSLAQWKQCREKIAAGGPSGGLRINPEQSSSPSPIYDPCAPGSRLGVRARDLEGADMNGLSGFSFHALCQQDSHALERVLDAVEKDFSRWLPGMDWLNFGGGHHVTRSGYEVDHLCRLVERLRDRYGLQIYLEPGEAVALDAGYLVATVLDLVENDGPVAILDASASTHMPDVLEMPYTPEIVGAAAGKGEGYVARLGGPSCLAGDMIGTYSFTRPLEVGQRLCFTDMAHYTMVKNNTFNGIPLPSIAIWDEESRNLEIVREFSYQDYKNRLS